MLQDNYNYRDNALYGYIMLQLFTAKWNAKVYIRLMNNVYNRSKYKVNHGLFENF